MSEESITDIGLDKLAELAAAVPAIELVKMVAVLIIAMILVQYVKILSKRLFAKSEYRFWRRSAIFVIAWVLGYLTAQYFDLHGKVAVFIGFINPLIYFSLVQYATVKQRIVMLAMLKGRPVIETPNGDFKVDDTQTIYLRK